MPTDGRVSGEDPVAETKRAFERLAQDARLEFAKFLKAEPALERDRAAFVDDVGLAVGTEQG